MKAEIDTYLCAPFERIDIAYWIGEVVEWSITAVLKTVDVKASGGSNPSLSAVTVEPAAVPVGFFCTLLQRHRRR